MQALICDALQDIHSTPQRFYISILASEPPEIVSFIQNLPRQKPANIQENVQQHVRDYTVTSLAPNSMPQFESS